MAAAPEPIPLRPVPRSGATVEGLMDEVGPPRGYPQVATFMANYPEMAMVRRFRGLNARNLLYLQAELVQIEKELLKCEKDDAADRHDVRKPYFAKDLRWLIGFEMADKNYKQFDLIQRMRQKLKEYNDVLIQQTTLTKISNPSDHNSKVMQEWFSREDRANWPLEGDDASIWGHDPDESKCDPGTSRYIEDLIAISDVSSDVDRTTAWLAEKFVPNYYAKIANRFRKGIPPYRQRSLHRFTLIVATTLSSLLPVLSIAVLYIVHSMPARLGIIAGFTAAFSLVLTVITSAKRAENFAATAAFAAVQVVFVGSTGSSSNVP